VKADSLSTSSDTAYYPLGVSTGFNFSGNPFTITFFSGEVGHRYDYRNRVSVLGTSRFIFTNAINLGTQTNTLQVMLSTDFKGVAVNDTTTTLANMAAATWKDITPAVLATNATAVTDTIDLSSYAGAGKPVFIAFKYKAQSGTLQNKWTISNINVTNTTPDNTTYTIANGATTAISNPGGASAYGPGWAAYTPSNTKKWAFASNNWVIDSTSAASTGGSESWMFMGPVDLTGVTPDLGVPVKAISASVAPYVYTYATRGIYQACFLAGNNSAYASTDTIVRRLPIVIK
jgi:hypothetical protein